MNSFTALIVLLGLVAVSLGKPSEGESVEPTKLENTEEIESIARDKRGILYGAAYTAPLTTYSAAYTAPVAYSPYPYAYSAAYSAYPYYAAGYSAPYYLA